MTLTTHAITGATVAALIPSHPVLGFVAAFASHFVLDAIPHWAYSIKSLKEDEENPMNSDMVIGKDFYFDILKIGADGILGLLASFVLLSVFLKCSPFIVLLGAIAGMMPDALQFVYWKWKHKPLTSLHRFHIYIHAKTDLNKRPVVGILLQLVLVCIVLVLAFPFLSKKLQPYITAPLALNRTIE
jgi:hypothetical protein